MRVIKSIRLRAAEHLSKMEESGSTFKVLTCKLTREREREREEEKETDLGRFRLRWEDNNIIVFEEKEMSARHCIDSVQNRENRKANVNETLILPLPQINE